MLSSSLNNGLITPEFVIKKSLIFAKKYKTPINSLEGFIRQIIGWREFIRGIYLIKGRTQAKQNFFHHKNKLSLSFWTGSTGISPVDITIKKILRTAYAHHIERLMVLGNFMLLTETNPHQAYTWFMELFIDAYDWVMVPNIYGMSQYADAGMMTTKPYFSGSNYLKKMSNYSPGKWQEIWDSLYWRFIANHHELIKSNARLNFMNVYLARIHPAKLHEHIKRANIFIKALKYNKNG